MSVRHQLKLKPCQRHCPRHVFPCPGSNSSLYPSGSIFWVLADICWVKAQPIKVCTYFALKKISTFKNYGATLGLFLPWCKLSKTLFSVGQSWDGSSLARSYSCHGHQSQTVVTAQQRAGERSWRFDMSWPSVPSRIPSHHLLKGLLA